jgi:hypothetical protein
MRGRNYGRGTAETAPEMGTCSFDQAMQLAEMAGVKRLAPHASDPTTTAKRFLERIKEKLCRERLQLGSACPRRMKSIASKLRLHSRSCWGTRMNSEDDLVAGHGYHRQRVCAAIGTFLVLSTRLIFFYSIVPMIAWRSAVAPGDKYS